MYESGTRWGVVKEGCRIYRRNPGCGYGEKGKQTDSPQGMHGEVSLKDRNEGICEEEEPIARRAFASLAR
jgi:hypothetical protein